MRDTAQPQVETLSAHSELFKDPSLVTTSKWKLGAAKALTADGTVRTPLSAGEKGMLVDFVRGVRPAELRPLDPAQPTSRMDANQLAAYQALTPDYRARYDSLYREATTNRQVGPFGAEVANPKTSEKALRTMLTSGDLASFFQVEDALGGAGGEKAKADLHQALFQKALGERGSREMGGHHSTISYLAQIADPNAQLLPGLDRQDLLASVVHDLNHPEDIAQGEGNFNCGGSNVAFFLAATSPSEYARQIAGLATQGEVKLDPTYNQIRGYFAGQDEGESLKFNGKIDPNSATSVSSQLYGGAFTSSAKEIAPPPPGTTTTGTDKQGAKGLMGSIRDVLNQRGGYGGISGVQLSKELNAMGGQGWDAIFMPSNRGHGAKTTLLDRTEARSTAEAVLKGASAQTPVFVNVNHHWLGVTGFDPATGQVQYFDPNHRDGDSHLKSMSADDLFKRATDFVYQPATVPDLKVPDSMRDTRNSNNGGGGSSTGGVGSGGGSGSNG